MALAIKYSRLHYLCGAVAIILGAVVTTGTVSTRDECTVEEINQFGFCHLTALRVLFASLSAVATSVTAIQTFMDYQKGSERNKKVADEYSSLERGIDTILRIPVTGRDDPLTTLQSLRNRYDDITANAPPIRDEDEELETRARSNSRRTRQPSILPTSMPPAPLPNLGPSIGVQNLIKILNDSSSEQDGEIDLDEHLPQASDDSQVEGILKRCRNSSGSEIDVNIAMARKNLQRVASTLFHPTPKSHREQLTSSHLTNTPPADVERVEEVITESSGSHDSGSQEFESYPVTLQVPDGEV